MKGLKIDQLYDNPFDNINNNICEKYSDFFRKKLDIDPNILTFISNITWIISAIILYMTTKENKILFIPLSIIFYLISYFFHCFYNYFSRKYIIHSDKGKKYNQINNLMKSITIFYILYLKINHKFFKSSTYLIILFIIFIIFIFQVSCEEKLYNKKIYKPCDNNDLCKYMKITRFFSYGSFILLNSISFLLVS